MGAVFIIFGTIGTIVGIVLTLIGFFDPTVVTNLGWAGLIVLGLATPIGISGACIEIKNWFYDKYQQIQEATAGIGVYERQQEELKTKLAELLEKYVDHEKELIDTVKQRGTDKLMALLERYPDLKASETVAVLIRNLVSLREAIADQEKEYNSRVREYNTWTQQVPQRSFRPASLPGKIDFK
jgi:hypothetical protein